MKTSESPDDDHVTSRDSGNESKVKRDLTWELVWNIKRSFVIQGTLGSKISKIFGFVRIDRPELWPRLGVHGPKPAGPGPSGSAPWPDWTRTKKMRNPGTSRTWTKQTSAGHRRPRRPGNSNSLSPFWESRSPAVYPRTLLTNHKNHGQKLGCPRRVWGREWGLQRSLTSMTYY